MLFKKTKIKEQVEEPIKKNLKDLKKFLKEMASSLRALKLTRKLDKRGKRALWEIESEIFHLKSQYRHHFIGYCEMRGTERSKIENPAEENLPNESRIEKVKEEYLASWWPEEKEAVV